MIATARVALATALLVAACGGSPDPGEPGAAGLTRDAGGDTAPPPAPDTGPGAGAEAAPPGDGGGIPGDPPLDGGCAGGPARFATEVVSTAFGPGQSAGRTRLPDIALGPPRGGGECEGSVDVVSLGNGGTVTLGFGATRIVDGPGPDFVVYENPFGIGCDPEAPFAELGTVAVSADGERFVEFPCTAAEAPFGACSGHSIVRAPPAGVPESELDPLALGGEAYDLADVGLAEARFVRVTDRADLTGTAGVYDLDAVGVVHGSCP